MDECSDSQLVFWLRNDNHDVLYITEYSPGLRDKEVLDIALEESRILITEDKDFGELVFRFKLKVPGVILLRFNSQEKDAKISRLRKLIQLKNSFLEGKYTVVDNEKYRIRKFI